jgi:hypothetical protein
VTWIGLSVSYPVAGSAIACGAGLAALVLVGYRMVDPPFDGDVGLEPGAWLALAASAGIVVGGYLGMQESEA